MESTFEEKLQTRGGGGKSVFTIAFPWGGGYDDNSHHIHH